MSSRVALISPPETIREGQCFCRFEPDGLAVLNGYLRARGLRDVDLISCSPDPLVLAGRTHPKKKVLHWGISEHDREGTSFRKLVHAALTQSLDGPVAQTLKRVLPTHTLQSTAILGLSLGFSAQIFNGLVLARLAKQLNPRLFVVLGGTAVTCNIEFVSTLGELAPLVDGIIAGFGEEPLAQLVRCVADGADLGTVANLYRPHEGGFRLNEASWTPDESTMLTMPDYQRPSLERRFDPYFPVRASVGCYWSKCTFCTYPTLSTGTSEVQACRQTTLEPKALVRHFQGLMERGAGNRFELITDALSPVYCLEFANEVLAAGLQIKWNVWSCFDKNFARPGLLDTMKRAGCQGVLMGLESASPRILKLMKKMQSKEDITRVLGAFEAAGVAPFLTTFIGFPTETREEAMETIDALRTFMATYSVVSNDRVRLYRFALQALSPLAQRPSEHGITAVDWSDIYSHQDTFSPRFQVASGMGYDEVKTFVEERATELGLDFDDWGWLPEDWG